MLRNRSLRLVGLLAVLAASSNAADATMVHWDHDTDADAVYSDVVFAKKPFYASVIKLRLKEPGVYRVTVTDLRWRDAALKFLAFGVFTATAPIQTMDGAGSLEFFYAGRGKAYLAVFAMPKRGKRVGLIGIEVTRVTSTAVVPLPASLWLLLSALTAVAFFWRRPQRGTAAFSRSASVHASAMASRAFAASAT